MHKTFVFLASFVAVLTLVGSVATGGIVFLDDFEDGSATDGAPVAWAPVPGAIGSFEVIDGDYVLTRPRDSEEMYSAVNQHTLGDTSIRTQARMIGSNAWWFGLFARVNLTPQTAYIALLKNNGNLEIWLFGPSPGTLASAHVGIDPRLQDVRLRFDVIGNKLSAWAWRQGDPMPTNPQVTTTHSGLRSGFVGLAGDLGNRLSESKAIFRYVEVYEPIPPSPDFNGDGIVDLKDFSKLAQHWGKDESSVDIGPMPWGDGTVDTQDLRVLAERWLEETGLIAHWRLDETEGTIGKDSVGEHDGTLNGNPVWQPENAKVAGALEFDGDGDYVSTPFVLDPAAGAFSVFAWIKGGGAEQAIISQGGGVNWLAAGTSQGKLMTELKATGRFGTPLFSEAVIIDGNWHRVGFTWDGSTRTLYVDGSEVAKGPQGTFVGSTGGLYIGAGKNLEPGSFWSGLIDDVRLYDRAVTP